VIRRWTSTRRNASTSSGSCASASIGFCVVGCPHDQLEQRRHLQRAVPDQVVGQRNVAGVEHLQLGLHPCCVDALGHDTDAARRVDHRAAAEAVPLSRLIDVVNDRFGTDFNQADQLFFDQIVEAAISDAALKQVAAVNPGDKFELVFKNLLEALFVERMDQNEEIFARFMNDKSFQKVVTGWLSSEAYRKLNGPAGS